MMRRDKAQPIERNRRGPVIERVGHGAAVPQRSWKIAGYLMAAAGLLAVLADGRLMQQLDGTFNSSSAPAPQSRPALPQIAPQRTEAPKSEPPKPQPPKPEPPRAEVPNSTLPRPAPPISQPAPPPALPPVASASPVVPPPPPAPSAPVSPAPVSPAPVSPAPASPSPSRVSLLVPRPPGARPAVAPFADADVTQVVTKQIRRFNESRDVAEKQDAGRQIHAAAIIGHPLARSIIVSAYRTSTIVQNASTPADVVRIALDFAPKGQSDSAAARGFAALAGHLAERDEAGFGRAVLDAMRDDARLREPSAVRAVVDALANSAKACAALAGAAGSVSTVGCDGVLANGLMAQAVARGPSGQEDASYKNAERAFARYLQDAL